VLTAKAEGVFGLCREVSVRLWDNKLVGTPAEEHGEAVAGEGARIMPCPGTVVDRNPNYGCSQPCYWLDLGAWSSGSLASVRLLDLAWFPTRILFHLFKLAPEQGLCL